MSRLLSLFIRVFIGALAVGVLTIIFLLPTIQRQEGIDNAPPHAIKILNSGKDRKEAFIYVGMSSEQLNRAYRIIGYDGYSPKYRIRNNTMTVRAYSDSSGTVRHLISCDKGAIRMPGNHMLAHGLGLTNEVRDGSNRVTEYHDVNTGEIVIVERSDGRVTQRDYIEAGNISVISDTLTCR